MEPHIADAEDEFFVMAVTPDMCKVGKIIVAFEPMQKLPPEKARYSKHTFARGEKILMIDSVVKGMKGNAGKGVLSGVAVGSGNSVIKQGSETVFVEDRMVARHGDEVDINVAA